MEQVKNDGLWQRRAIFSEESYIPWQPGFERFGAEYHHQFVHDDIVADFYEIDSADFTHYALPTIPDGCTDFMFTKCGDVFHGYISTGVRAKKDFYFGEIEYLFGIRFMPGATCLFFRNPIREIVERPVYIEDLFAEGDSLLSRLTATSSFEERVAVATKFLQAARLQEDGQSKLLGYCTKRMYQTRGNEKLSVLAEDTGYTDRYIRNLFTDYIGISPKSFCQMLRLQYILLLLAQHPHMNLEAVAAFAGYDDLSHMNRDCRRYMGCSSRQVRTQDFCQRGSKDGSIMFPC